MSTTDIALNLGLLALMILTQYGTRRWDSRKLLLPFGLVAVAGAYFLPGAPTIGNDVTLDLVGIMAGLVLGIIAASLVEVRRGDEGTVITRAGIGYVIVWTIVIGGRMLFAWGAENAWSSQIRDFSIQHLITGADAWRTAFVLMALVMVCTRSLVTAARAGYLATRRYSLA